MFIADAQAHIWQRVRPGAEAQAHRAEPFGADELLGLMDQAGVARAILVPTSWSDDNGNELALKAARAHPESFGVFGVLALDDPASRQALPGWRDTPGMLGVRASFHTEALAPLLTDGTADWLWPAAEHSGVPLMVYAPGQTHLIARIAREHPRLKLIVDHLGLPRLGPNVVPEEHVRKLLDLAPLTNVAVKASALPAFSREPFPFKDMLALAQEALRAFGAERVFWGSDLTRQTCPYRESLAMFAEHLPASDRERELVMGRALCDWISWP